MVNVEVIMEIRKAAKKDILQLSELFRQEIEYHQQLARYYEILPDFDWFAYVEGKLKDRNRLTLVAERDDGIAGFIVVKIMDYQSTGQYKSILQKIRCYVKKTISLPIKPVRWGFIEGCYVIPSLRRQGIGSQLVSSAMKWFQSKQISRIELSLAVNNKEGETFWEKSGFETFRLSLSKDVIITQVGITKSSTLIVTFISTVMDTLLP